jgi:hypothetical protein
MDLNLSLRIEARTMTDAEGTVLLGKHRGVVFINGHSEDTDPSAPSGDAESLIWQSPDSHPFNSEREAVVATYNYVAVQFAKMLQL